jgi:3-methyladenine DNA glycosylase AlkD
MDWAQKLEIFLKQHQNPGKAVGMSAYMRNQFPFLGLQSPQRKELLKTFSNQHPWPEKDMLKPNIEYLWQLDEREFQYMGIELFNRFKKAFDENDLVLIEYMITHKSWWDTVDSIGGDIAGTFFKLHPGIIPHTEKWVESNNLWLQRSAIIFQLKYKHETDVDLLCKYILQLRTSDEFFIQKAFGWSLRQLARYKPEEVIEFVRKNKLPSLSRREALKHISS